MTRAIRSELIKLAKTPSTYWMSGGALALVAIAISLTLAVGTVKSPSDVESLFSFSGSGGLVALLVGVAAGSAAYRYKTVVADLLASPDRVRYVAAQAAALGAFGGVLGLICSAMACAIVLPWLTLHGGGLLGEPILHVSAGIAGTVSYCALSAVIGLAIGGLARNQVASVSVVLLALAVVDPTISALTSAGGKFGPSAVGIAITGGTVTANGPYAALLPIWAAALEWASLAAVLLTASIVVTRIRDIS